MDGHPAHRHQPADGHPPLVRDAFVVKLRAAGVDAVMGYRFIPEDGPIEEPKLREAVAQAGVDATLMTRLVRVERKTSVDPRDYYYPPIMGFAFCRGYDKDIARYVDAVIEALS